LARSLRSPRKNAANPLLRRLAYRRTLKGWSRRNEHAAVLAEIERIVCERQIDTLIVTSDIFDSMAPSAKARSMFYGAMDHIHERRPGLSSIVIAGNHDHAGQLEAPSVLLRRLGTRVVGTLRQADGRLDLAEHHDPQRSGRLPESLRAGPAVPRGGLEKQDRIH
jgi:DNA repair protein SbcD/Mre11